MSEGIFAGIKIGYACPKCRIYMEKPPNPTMPICNYKSHRLPETIREVLCIETADKPVFINMEVFGGEQRNVLYAIIRNLNDAWQWTLTHEHAQISMDAAAPEDDKDDKQSQSE